MERGPPWGTEVLVATWNVNSVRARAERVQGWLAARKPDVACLQETKVEDALFPHPLFEELGYRAVIHGQKTYNGVALIVRKDLEVNDVVRGLAGTEEECGRRVIAATVGGLRIVNVYVVNGQAVGSDKYAMKLRWLEALRGFLAEEMRKHAALVVLGDFNIAPADLDVHDPAAWEGKVLCSEPERAALAAMTALGLTDVFRAEHPEAREFSWWDYRMLGFPKNHGLRIDLMLATADALARCTSVQIDRDERRGKNASDHAPVLAEFG